MFGEKRDERRILSAHSKWIAELRNASRRLETRLRLLESRVAIIESQLVEFTRTKRQPRSPGAS